MPASAGTRALRGRFVSNSHIRLGRQTARSNIDILVINCAGLDGERKDEADRGLDPGSEKRGAMRCCVRALTERTRDPRTDPATAPSSTRAARVSGT